MEQDTKALRRGTTSALVWLGTYIVYALMYGLYMALIPMGLFTSGPGLLIQLLAWGPTVIIVGIIAVVFVIRRQVTVTGLMTLLPPLISWSGQFVYRFVDTGRMVGVIAAGFSILSALVVLVALVIIALGIQPHREWALVMVPIGLVVLILQNIAPMVTNPLLTMMTGRANLIDLLIVTNNAINMLAALLLAGCFAALAYAGLSAGTSGQLPDAS